MRWLITIFSVVVLLPTIGGYIHARGYAMGQEDASMRASDNQKRHNEFMKRLHVCEWAEAVAKEVECAPSLISEPNEVEK